MDPKKRGITRVGVAFAAAMFLLATATWFLLLHRRSQDTEIAGLATAKALADQVVVFREVYSKEVLARARFAGFAIDDHVTHGKKSLPLPVTMVNYFGLATSSRIPGARLRVFSRYPFRGDLTLDTFEDAALHAVTKHPDDPYYEITERNGRPIMRYAVADRMTTDCVSCHNEHPRSPKKDWQVGDVRGAVEVAVPLDDLANELYRSDIGTTGLLLGGFVFLSFVVVVFVRYDLRRSARETWALTDELTGVATRRGGMETIARELARAERHGIVLSVVLLDLDHFKRINDTHGHHVGDQVLAQMGKILRDSLRSGDCAVRWGGEEFLVLLSHTNKEEALRFAERIRRATSAIVVDPPITVSLGVAEVSPSETFEEAVARADQRLYEAKSGGRNRSIG